MEKDSQQLHRRGSDTSALAALGRAQRKRAERRKSRRDFPEPTWVCVVKLSVSVQPVVSFQC